MAKNKYLLSILLAINTSLFAQYNINLYNENDLYKYYQFSNRNNEQLLPSVKSIFFTENISQLDSFSLIQTKFYKNKYLKWLRNSDFFTHKDSTLFLTVNPIIDYKISYLDNNKLIENSRGVLIKGSFSKNFGFITGLVENQAFYPDYIKSYIVGSRVIPGFGRFKGFKDTGYDFAYSFGMINWTPLKNINIQAGQGKNFIGEGYRSLILSDFSSFYPFIKITSKWKRLEFTHLYTAFQEIQRNDSRLLAYHRSHGSFNTISLHLPTRLTFSFTESIIWNTTLKDKNNQFPLTFFNPIMGINSLIYGLNHQNNIILGLNASWHPIHQIHAYAQLIIDDLSSNYSNDSLRFHDRYGYQMGIRIIEPFKIKNLFMLWELNRIRPFTYSHELTSQSYTGFNDALAHPSGANFREVVFQLHYQFKSWMVTGSLNQITVGKDPKNEYFGSSLYRSDTLASFNSEFFTGNIFQGDKRFIHHSSIELGYIINPKYNFIISAGIHQRLETRTPSITYTYLRLSTRILNKYNDF